MAAVLLDNVSHALGGRWVISCLDLQLGLGERLLVTGANGAGKSSLLRLIATLTTPQHGAITLFGQRVCQTTRVSLRRRLALMGHQHHFYEALSAQQNLGLALRLVGQHHAGAAALLDRVGLAAHADAPLHTLSAGMKRRLVLARLLGMAPELVLLDEPYSQLDAAGATLMDEALARWHGAGVTTIVVSHEPERLRASCSAHLRLAAGRAETSRGRG